jgi:hypothetical protein
LSHGANHYREFAWVNRIEVGRLLRQVAKARAASKENTQARHYTPELAAAVTQLLNPIRRTRPIHSQIHRQLRKLG